MYLQTAGQAEALDLSKRSTPQPRSSLSQSHPVSVGILQSQHPSPARKLLEKALTSGLSNTDFQLGPISTSQTVFHNSGRKSAELAGNMRHSRKLTKSRLTVPPLMSID